MSDFKKKNTGPKDAEQRAFRPKTAGKPAFKKTYVKKSEGGASTRPATGPAQSGEYKPPPKTTGRPVLRIDMGALKDNYRALTKLVEKPGKPVTVAACVKADAYGVGMGPVAKALYGLGCRCFFVAHASEGRLLREIVGKTPAIYVFNGPSEAEMQIFFGSKLKPVLNSIHQARMWSDAIRRHEFQPRAAIHIDTGMNRLGFTQYDMAALVDDKDLQNALDIDLIMSHLACAPDARHALNSQQLLAFKKAAASLPPTTLSLANSAGIYLGKPFHFNMVRPGAALYGLQVTNNAKHETTRPVVTLAAPILQMRMVLSGQSIGYNATFTAKRNTRTLIVGAGYADGIPVAASNKSYASLNGQRLPIIGRVSMDLTILDATDYKGEIKIGQQVEFLGNQLEMQSSDINGLNYEMLTRLGSRFRREYS